MPGPEDDIVNPNGVPTKKPTTGFNPAHPHPVSPEFLRKLQQDKARGVTPDDGPGDSNLSPATLIDMYRNGLIDEAALRARLVKLGLSDKPSDEFKGKSELDAYLSLATKQKDSGLSISAMANGKAKGFITDKQIKDRLGKDFNPEDAEIMFKLIQDQAAGEGKDLSVSQLSNAMKRGLMSKEQVYNQLKEQGYNDTDAATLLNLAQAETKNKSLSTAAMADAFKRGDLKEDEVLRRLQDPDSYDLSREDAQLMVNEMKQTTKLGLGPLGELYVEGQMNPEQTKAKLMNEHNYSSEDADYLIQTFQNDKNKAALAAQEKAEREREKAANAAERAQDKAERAKEKAENKAERAMEENKRPARLLSDGVDGFLENFHKDLTTTLRDANLNPQVQQWALQNEDLILTQSVGNGRKGGVLSGQAIATLYEGMRGAARKQGETHDSVINAQQV